ARQLGRERPLVLESWNGYVRGRITEREARYRELYLDLWRTDPDALNEPGEGDLIALHAEGLSDGVSGLVRPWQADGGLLVPVFGWLAVRWPNRGLHDWVAGTFPVAR